MSLIQVFTRTSYVLACSSSDTKEGIPAFWVGDGMGHTPTGERNTRVNKIILQLSEVMLKVVNNLFGNINQNIK